MQGQEIAVQAPDGLHVVSRRAARDAVRVRRRCDLRRPPRPVHCSASATSISCSRARSRRTPACNVAALRPYKGYSALRIAENSGRSLYNSLQLSADKRYSNGFKFGVAYTLGKSEDNASGLRNVLWNTYDDSNFWGPSSFDRTHVLSVYYIYDLPFWRDPTSLMKNLLGGWQISGLELLPHGHAVLDHPNQRHRGSRRRRQRTAGRSRRRYQRQLERQVLGGRGQGRRTSSSTPRRSPTRRPARSATRPATSSATRATSSGTWRSSRTSASTGTQKMQFRVEMFNFINHPNLSGAD